MLLTPSEKAPSDERSAFIEEGPMGIRVAEKRLLNVGTLTLILVAGLIAIPEILAEFWLKIQSFASARFQFAPGRLQAIALVVVTLGAGFWIMLGLLKDEYSIRRRIDSPARKKRYMKARRAAFYSAILRTGTDTSF
jgi:hypothetical protein